MKITFIASLQGGTTMKLGDENDGKITLTFDGSEWGNVARLTMYQRKPLKITIDTDVKP
jgi:hypothetical protein